MYTINTPHDLRVHSYRKRLIDIDNINAKAAIDGLVLTGLLQDDSPQYIKKITYTQEKCGENDRERTKFIFTEVKDGEV